MENMFIQTVHEVLETPNIGEYRNRAYEMISYAKTKLGKKRFSKYYFNSVERCLKQYGKKDNMNVKPVTRDQCIFITFLIMNMKCALTEEIVGNYYVSLLNRLYRSIHAEILINACMDDIILFFCLCTKQSWETWIDLQAEWEKKDKTPLLSYAKLIFPSNRTLHYSDFKQIVEKGLKENSKETLSSYLEADRTLMSIIDVYNKERKTKLTISNIFPADIQAVMANTERRRTWYLYRIIIQLIDSQIDEIINNLISWKAQCSTEKKFREAVEKCWIKTNHMKIDKIIAGKGDIEEKGKRLREMLCLGYITFEKIAKSYEECLGGNVFVKPKYRLYYYMVDAYEKGEEYKSIWYYPQQYFKTNKEYTTMLQGVEWKFDKKEERTAEELWEKLTTPKRTARPFIKIFSGGKSVTREMLLLTVLVAKSQGYKTIAADYVENHVLRNSRFDMEFDEEKPFDEFYMKAYHNIENIKTYAAQLEKECLAKGKGSVFYNIICGKDM